MERNEIRINRCDNSVLILTPVEGKPSCYSVQFETGGKFDIAENMFARHESFVAAVEEAEAAQANL